MNHKGKTRKRIRCRIVEMTAPFPPSINAYWIPIAFMKYDEKAKKEVPTARMVVTQEGKKYHRAISQIAFAHDLHSLKLDGRLALRMTFHSGTKRSYDINNRIKVLEDALMHAGIIVDDEQVDRTRTRRGKVCPGNPHVELVIIERTVQTLFTESQ